jgi:imidazoleglycerol-phosphate dehydratase
MNRKTNETDINIDLDIAGKGNYEISTRIRFLDHMLELFSKHGNFDLKIKAKGDLDIDQHHTIEDIGITIGQAFDKALGDKKGINRAGFFAMPMDETLAIVAIDLCGRPTLKYDVKFKSSKIGDLDSDLVKEFFKAFSDNLRCSLHIRSFEADTDHHKIEAIFKGFGRALSMACSKNPKLKDSIPSTKGII